MKIALAQINPTLGALRQNREKIVEAIEKARTQGAELILFPELALSGYPPEDLLLLPNFLDAIEETLLSLLPHCCDIAVILGIPRRNPLEGEKRLYNSACIIENGTIHSYYDKMLLPDYDVFSERRYFDPGREIKVWNYKGKKIGVLICEDMWGHAGILEYVTYMIDPIEMLAESEVDLVINLSASPFFVGGERRRESVLAKATHSLRCPLVFVNQVGGNDSLIFDGNSMVMDEEGEIVAKGASFQEDLLIWDYGLKQKVTPPLPAMASLLKALVLGTRDYFRKTGLLKAIVGFSGGIDSALTAYIAQLALGKENVQLLFMPSRYTSEESREDAKAQAALLSIPLTELSIEKPFTSYLEILEPLFAGTTGGITEENLQARVRGMILMAYSNQLGSVVLSTGNKSELAMGYTTLYGDMCGGLAPLGDVTKSQVVELARWLNQSHLQIVERIIEKPPSAELRENQKDSDTLPPYDILDRIIEGYIHNHLSTQEIAKKEGIELDLVQEIVQKIHRNEYKRQQAPPLLRVTKRSLIEGRRFPIAEQWDFS